MLRQNIKHALVFRTQFKVGIPTIEKSKQMTKLMREDKISRNPEKSKT